MPTNGYPEVADLVNGRNVSSTPLSKDENFQQIEQTREETIYNTTHGSDRGHWRDGDMKFTNRDEPGAHLHFTANQIEEARKEMEEELDSTKKENEGLEDIKPISEEDNTTKIKTDTVIKDPIDLIPQEPLVDYTKMTEVREPLIKEVSSDTSTRRMIYPFGDEQIKFGFNELKEALESRKLQLFNGDVYLTYLSGRKDENGNPISKTPIVITNEQYDSIQKAIAHQDALDTNEKANEGFTSGLSKEGSKALADIDLISDDLLGKNFKNSLSELMHKETAEKYISFLKRDETTPQVITPEQTDIDTRLGEINSKIGEMNTHLSELDTDILNLLKGQEVGQLTQEQLLEYVKLLQEQSKTQFEMTQTNQEKFQLTMESVLTAIFSKLNNSTETPIIEPTVVEPPVVDPSINPDLSSEELIQETYEPMSDKEDILGQIEPQLRDLRGENTLEQQWKIIALEMAEMEYYEQSGGSVPDADRARYLDLQTQKNKLEQQLNILQIDSEKKRLDKEKWIKIAAGVAGFGVALATPAIGVAAVIGVTLGGRIVGKGLQSLGTKLRSKSDSLKYESRKNLSISELVENDKRQKRNQWWANRLGEAGAVLIGGSTGYGLGSLFEGIVGKDFYIGMNNQPTMQAPSMPGNRAETPSEAPRPESRIPQLETTPQPQVGGGIQQPTVEEWLPGDSFNASDLGWNFNEMGWLGNKVYLTNAGGNSGVLQGNFFRELSRLVPKDQLIGQSSGNVVNQFLRAAYGGMNPSEAASKAAELILGK